MKTSEAPQLVRYISSGFTYRSKTYPVGASLDGFDAPTLSQFVRSGHAVVNKSHPSQSGDTTTTKEQQL
ncbi:MAG: hypothetical protein WC091_01180 [Sulfuricellaceae bacterium]